MADIILRGSIINMDQTYLSIPPVFHAGARCSFELARVGLSSVYLLLILNPLRFCQTQTVVAMHFVGNPLPASGS